MICFCIFVFIHVYSSYVCSRFLVENNYVNKNKYFAQNKTEHVCIFYVKYFVKFVSRFFLFSTTIKCKHRRSFINCIYYYCTFPDKQIKKKSQCCTYYLGVVICLYKNHTKCSASVNDFSGGWCPAIRQLYFHQALFSR